MGKREELLNLMRLILRHLEIENINDNILDKVRKIIVGLEESHERQWNRDSFFEFISEELGVMDIDEYNEIMESYVGYLKGEISRLRKQRAIVENLVIYHDIFID